jgi:hypothetical protein
MATPQEKQFAIDTLKKAAANGAEFSPESQRKIIDKYGIDVWTEAFTSPDARPKSGYGPGQAAIRGIDQGVTAGFGDEGYGVLYGAIPAAVKGIYDVATGPNKLKDLPDVVKKGYIAERNINRDMDKASKTAFPYQYGAGEIGGSVAGSLPFMLTGPAGALAKAGASVAPKLIPAIGRGVVGGASMGAAQGAGYSEGDATDTIGGVAKGAAVGAGLGAAVPAIGAAGRGLTEAGGKGLKALVGQTLGGVSPEMIAKRVALGREAVESAPRIDDLTMRFLGDLGTAGDVASAARGRAVGSLAGSGETVSLQELLASINPAIVNLEKTATKGTAERVTRTLRRELEKEFSPNALQTGEQIPIERLQPIIDFIGKSAEYGKPLHGATGWTPKAAREARRGVSNFAKAIDADYGKSMEQSAENMDILNMAKGIAKTPEQARSMLKSVGRTVGGENERLATLDGKPVKVSDILRTLGEETGTDYLSLAERAAVRDAFNAGAERTGVSMGIGGGLGAGAGLGAGYLGEQAGLPSWAKVPLALGGAALGTAGRSYYGPRMAAGALDAMSAIDKNATLQAILSGLGRASDTGIDVAGTAGRTAAMSPESKRKGPNK